MNREKYLEEQVEILTEEKRELVEALHRIANHEGVSEIIAREALARVNAKEKI